MRNAALIWHQSMKGRAIDMVRPRASEVDFREIADAMAQLNRYAGQAATQVSVGLHTLIALAAATEQAKPYVLLHDAHETRVGEWPTPATKALQAIATEMAPNGAALMAYALTELKRRHDDAIFEAAGLEAPSMSILAAVHQADLVALQTERRDFLAPTPKPWDVDAMGISALPKVYRWRPAPDVADELYRRFEEYLPALMTETKRAKKSTGKLAAFA